MKRYWDFGRKAKNEIVQPDDHNWCMISPRALFASPDARDWEGRCRRMTFAAYVGDDTVLCRTLSRFKMYVSTKDDGLAPHLIGEGYWEMWVTRVMTQLIEPGMVCIDAGANIGYYTVLMGELAGPDGKVVAAEPVPATRRLLERNVRINGFEAFTTILDTAFGADRGEVTMFVPPGEPKNALIWDGALPGWEELRVPLQRIDDLDLPRVDFVKIDVEGAEIDLWRGMRETMARNRDIHILMEVNCFRYPAAAAGFLAEIAAEFPLRFVDHAGFHRPIRQEEVLSSREDVMLYLHRR